MIITNFALKNDIYYKDNSNLEMITDFAKAAITAINIVFPYAIASACFFHLSWSIYNKIQGLRLSCKYIDNPESNLLECQFPALAFLPVNKIKESWLMLKTQFDENDNQEQQLVTYFNNYYLYGKIRMRFKNNKKPKT